MSDTIALLKQLGFGEYEAKAYVALLQRSPLNGYELAKASAIPRANIYAILEKLQARGAVVRLEAQDGIRYAPVSPRDLTRQLGRQFQVNLDAAEEALTQVTAPVEEEYIWNARGYASLLGQAREMVDEAKQRLTAAVWPEESRVLSEPFAAAHARGVAMTTLCLAGCETECGNCRGRIHRYQVMPEQRTRWLVLVGDGEQVLAGELGVGDQALGVRTRQKLMVDLTSWYIHNSIAMAALLNDIGGRLDQMIGPETHALLKAMGPSGQDISWLEHMRSLLSRPQFQLPQTPDRKPPKTGEP